MRMYKLEQDIMEELYEENVRSNCGVKRLADTIVNHYFKEYLNEVVEQLEDCKMKKYVTGITHNPYEFGACHGIDDAIEIVKGGVK